MKTTRQALAELIKESIEAGAKVVQTSAPRTVIKDYTANGCTFLTKGTKVWLGKVRGDHTQILAADGITLCGLHKENLSRYISQE